MDVYEVAVSRRSIRRFKNKAVPYDALEKCVNAARLAPTARNRQLWEFIIIDDKELLPKVFDTITMWMGQPKPKGTPSPVDAPRAYIIALINTRLETEVGGIRLQTTYDIGLAVENIILVAQEQGIGSCPILSFDQNALKQILHVPDSHEFAIMLLMGYPAESPVAEVATGPINTRIDDRGVRHVPKRRLEDILHRNKFS